MGATSFGVAVARSPEIVVLTALPRSVGVCKPAGQRVLVEYLAMRVVLQPAPILQQRSTRDSLYDLEDG
ncbi:hypothetical protein HR51_09235 [Burkholderia cepacia]|nr:hypothetical protein HR51_09235 [Burkholderia cepacia]